MTVEKNGPYAEPPRPSQVTVAGLPKAETEHRRMGLRVSNAAWAGFDHSALQRPRRVARMATDWGGRAAWRVMHGLMTQVWRACDGPPSVGSFASRRSDDDAPQAVQLAPMLPFDVALTSKTSAATVEAIHTYTAGSSALRLPHELVLVDRLPLIDERADLQSHHHPAAVRLDDNRGLDRGTDSFDRAADSQLCELRVTAAE
jgi:hypothetical protein